MSVSAQAGTSASCIDFPEILPFPPCLFKQSGPYQDRFFIFVTFMLSRHLNNSYRDEGSICGI